MSVVNVVVFDVARRIRRDRGPWPKRTFHAAVDRNLVHRMCSVCVVHFDTFGTVAVAVASTNAYTGSRAKPNANSRSCANSVSNADTGADAFTCANICVVGDCARCRHSERH